MKALKHPLSVRDKEGREFKVYKYTIDGVNGEQNIWCNDWYGHHRIGVDCEWVTVEDQDEKIYQLEVENQMLRLIVDKLSNPIVTTEYATNTVEVPEVIINEPMNNAVKSCEGFQTKGTFFREEPCRSCELNPMKIPVKNFKPINP